MKLINIDENAPEIFYIFVHQFNPMLKHNFKLTKTFNSGAVNSCLVNKNFEKKYSEGSAGYLPYEPCKSDNLSPSPYLLSAVNNYRIEYDIEVYREKNHPLYPSRLSAIYAFGNFETCKLVYQKYNWPLNTVKNFRLKKCPLTRIAKVNMEHISLARCAYNVSMMQDIDRLWGGYWTGFDEIKLELPSNNFERKSFNSGVIWEYLIEGIIECIE